MQIDWISFTPIPSLLGGMILGVAAALYVLLHGLILGISGIVSGLLRPKADDRAWRIALIGGLLSAPILAQHSSLVSARLSTCRWMNLPCWTISRVWCSVMARVVLVVMEFADYRVFRLDLWWRH